MKFASLITGLVCAGASVLDLDLQRTLNELDTADEGSYDDTTPVEPLPNLVELAETAGLTTLVTAVTAAGLAPTLAGAGSFTVFAPNNDAFVKVDPRVLAALLELQNKDTLASILKYHVVPGIKTSSDIAKMGNPPWSLTTLEGPAVEVTGNYVEPEAGVGDAKLELILNNGAATIVGGDQMASNGVAHLIDAVLIPDSVKGKLAELAGPKCPLNMINPESCKCGTETETDDATNCEKTVCKTGCTEAPTLGGLQPTFAASATLEMKLDITLDAFNANKNDFDAALATSLKVERRRLSTAATKMELPQRRRLQNGVMVVATVGTDTTEAANAVVATAQTADFKSTFASALKVYPGLAATKILAIRVPSAILITKTPTKAPTAAPTKAPTQAPTKAPTKDGDLSDGEIAAIVICVLVFFGGFAFVLWWSNKQPTTQPGTGPGYGGTDPVKPGYGVPANEVEYKLEQTNAYDV